MVASTSATVATPGLRPAPLYEAQALSPMRQMIRLSMCPMVLVEDELEADKDGSGFEGAFDEFVALSER